LANEQPSHPFRGRRAESVAVRLTTVVGKGVSTLKHAAFILATSLLVFAPAASGAGDSTRTRGFQAHLDLASSPAEYVPGELIVGFRATAERGAMRRANARVGARVSRRFAAFRMQLVKLPHGLAVSDAVRHYRRDPAVSFAEPNYLRYATVVPTDLFGDLWGLDNSGQSHSVSDVEGGPTATPRSGTADADIDAPEAWVDETGDDTVVAVIDSGFDFSHSDLSTQAWTNPVDLPGNGDEDLNSYVDDFHGWDFVNNDNEPTDDFGHGTHVAGTIAAALDNSTGVVGVCPNCKIMVLEAIDSTGAITISTEIAALAYAKKKGAKIANMSFGGPSWSMAEREAIRTSGLLAVVAAGNDSLDNDMALSSDLTGDGYWDIASPSYPAAYTLPNILSVGASNHNDENAYSTECHMTFSFPKPLCAFTNWGHDSVDVSAPGADITSTVPGGSWNTEDGTSMAAPHAAGIAALVLAKYGPAFSVAQLKNAVMRSVDRPALLRTMYFNAAPGLTGPAGTTRTGSFTRTAGRVNAFTALNVSSTNATPLTDGNVDGARTMSTAKVFGTVAWPGDVNDVRKRKLTRGRTYRFTLVVPAGKDYDLYVWKPGAKEVWQPNKFLRGSARVGAADEVVKFRARSTGVYYIQVSTWLFKSGRYTLKFARLA
jgi:subtilisin family serine protease